MKLCKGIINQKQTAQEAEALASKRATEANAAFDRQIELLVKNLSTLDNKQEEVVESTEAMVEVEKKVTDATMDSVEAFKQRGMSMEEQRKATLKARAEFDKFAQSLLKGVKINIEDGGLDVKPLISDLDEARTAARAFSAAFDEKPTEILERQRGVINKFIVDAVNGAKTVTPAIQKMLDDFNTLGERINFADKIKEEAERAKGFIMEMRASIATSLGEAIGEALISGDPAEGFKSFVKDLLGLVKAFGATLIAIGTGLTASIFGIVEGPKTIAAGIALIAAATAGMALFAGGGLVFGETLGIVGEGRGTSKSNPEVIAPLDKLAGFMPQEATGQSESVVRIEGEELLIVARKVAENRSFTIRE